MHYVSSLSILGYSISKSTKQAAAPSASQLHLTEITSLWFYFPLHNTASHLATCCAAGSQDTGGLGLHHDAGFKMHKAHIPAQYGWPWQAGEQPCCKGCYSIQLSQQQGENGSEGENHTGQTQHIPPRAAEPSPTCGSPGMQANHRGTWRECR